MVVRQFVAEDGLEFLGVQQTQHRPGEHDVAFAGNEEKRRVGLRDCSAPDKP